MRDLVLSQPTSKLQALLHLNLTSERHSRLGAWSDNLGRGGEHGLFQWQAGARVLHSRVESCCLHPLSRRHLPE